MRWMFARKSKSKRNGEDGKKGERDRSGSAEIAVDRVSALYQAVASLDNGDSTEELAAREGLQGIIAQYGNLIDQEKLLNARREEALQVGLALERAAALKSRIHTLEGLRAIAPRVTDLQRSHWHKASKGNGATSRAASEPSEDATLPVDLDGSPESGHHHEVGSRPLALKLEIAYLLACTDVFVHEAQSFLTKRAQKFYVVGAFCFAIAAGVLAFGLWKANITEDLAPLVKLSGSQVGASGHGDATPGRSDIPTNALTYLLFRGLAYSALLFVALKGLIALGRSFFHEATRLLDRRHALRFGRLYMYLLRQDFDFNDLQEAFQWNKESSTSFLDIRPEVLTETVFNQLAKSLGKTAEAASNKGGKKE